MSIAPERLYRSSATPAADGADWTIALAGGNGIRLADYVQQRFGQRMPKQYCRLLGKRSMLEHTLDRMNEVTPAARTLTVIGTEHLVWAAEQLDGRSDQVFRQPSSRETGTALYVALAMLQRWAPDAVVTITPTDHSVAPAARNVGEVMRARELAGRHRDKVVLVGARPDEPDSELGYISLGEQRERAVYSLAPVIGFSRDILERSPERLLVTPLERVEWNDWGRADRIEATLVRRRARAVSSTIHRLPIANAS